MLKLNMLITNSHQGQFKSPYLNYIYETDKILQILLRTNQMFFFFILPSSTVHHQRNKGIDTQ